MIGMRCCRRGLKGRHVMSYAVLLWGFDLQLIAIAAPAQICRVTVAEHTSATLLSVPAAHCPRPLQTAPCSTCATSTWGFSLLLAWAYLHMYISFGRAHKI